MPRTSIRSLSARRIWPGGLIVEIGVNAAGAGHQARVGERAGSDAAGARECKFAGLGELTAGDERAASFDESVGAGGQRAPPADLGSAAVSQAEQVAFEPGIGDSSASCLRADRR